MSTNFYPLIFEPILQDRIWGGKKLKSELNKNIHSETTGESWEISTVKDNVSIISNGIFANQSLTELINQFPDEILGQKVYQKFGKQFPLLFKYLDAREDLSIQVHPNDALAKKRHNSFGKTEMWYILQADPGAKIIVGFKEKSNVTEYLQNLENKSLVDILKQVEVKKGDVFFIETGTVHAIGAGVVIAEIQQTSDITYRIYDWDRKDADQNARELHTDLALDAINFESFDAKKHYNIHENTSNEMVNCPFFITNFINLNGQMNFSEKRDCFKVFMCTEGSFDLQLHTEVYTFSKGQTILIPAVLADFRIIGAATILEIYIS